MTKKEKEIKEEFERKRYEIDKMEQKINITIWKMNRPKDLKEIEKIMDKYKKIIKILESE
jgi:hypothetical protein